MKANRLNETDFETTDDAGGHKHIVTATSCDCPDYRFRKSASGGLCKHMLFVKPLFDTTTAPVQQKLVNNHDEIINFIRQCGTADHYDIEQKFGNVDDAIQDMLSKGDIFSPRGGKYKVLE